MSYIVNNKFKLSNLVIMCSSLFINNSYASYVPSNIDLLILRDLAENLGKFKPGATNIPIYDNKGVLLTVIKEPIPDFTASGRKGLLSLVAPNLAVTAAHNRGLSSGIGIREAEYGYLNDFTDHTSGNKYMLRSFVTSPDYNKSHKTAYEITKVDFAVVSFNKLVTEVEPYTSDNLMKDEDKQKLLKDYTLFAHAGSGVLVQNDKVIYKAYKKSVANLFYKVHLDKYSDVLTRLDDKHPLTGLVNFGDSGSPLLGFNAEKNKWLLVGVVIFLDKSNDTSVYNVVNHHLVVGAHRNSEGVTGNSVNLDWKGASKSDINSTAMYDSNGRLNAFIPLRYNNKIILHSYTNKDNIVRLNRNIDQGSGFIEFHSNYDIKGINNDISWKGAGLLINHNIVVNWSVDGVERDTLHKLGKGTLVINGSGDRKGNIKIGDGELHLNRSNGKVADNILLVSGRPTVKIIKEEHLTGDNFTFGFRGGVLDLNGKKEINFTRIKHADSGARIINTVGDSLVNLVGTPRTSIFLGSFGVNKREEANLTVNISTTNNNDYVGLLGVSSINGDLNVNKGNAVIGATYTRHIENIHIPGEYDESSFTANNINIASGTSLKLGINTKVNANLNLESSTEARVGFISPDDDSNILCSYRIRSHPECKHVVLSQDIFDNVETTVIGNIKAKNNSLLVFGKSHFTGSIHADKDSNIVLNNNSYWLINSNSTVGNINNNGTILFKANNKNRIEVSAIEDQQEQTGKELIIKNKITGIGKVLVNVYDDGTSDKVVLDSDNNNLNIGFNGVVKNVEKIEIVEIRQGSNNTVNIDYENSSIDGFAYTISNSGGILYLEKLLNSICIGVKCFDKVIAEKATYNDANINSLSNSNYSILNYFSGLSTNINNVYINADIASSSSTYQGKYYLSTNQLNSYIHLGADSSLLFGKNNFIGGVLTISTNSVSGSITSNANIIKGLLYTRLGFSNNIFLNSGVGLHYIKSSYLSNINGHDSQIGFNFVSSLVGRMNLIDNLSLTPELSIEYYSLSRIKYNLLTKNREDIKFYLDGSSVFKFRLGAKLNYNIKSSNLYLASYFSTLSGYTRSTMNDFPYNFQHKRKEISVFTGINIGVSKSLTIDLNAGYTISRNYKASFLVSGSLKFSW